MLQKLKNLGNKEGGFTIVELLVVIVVIAILIALTVPQLFSLQQRARDTDRKSDIDSIRTALETHFNDQGEYPADIYTTGTDTFQEDYMDGSTPVDPETDDPYTYEAYTDDETTACTSTDTCLEYVLTADLENDNDRDADASGNYVVKSVNQE